MSVTSKALWYIESHLGGLDLREPLRMTDNNVVAIVQFEPEAAEIVKSWGGGNPRDVSAQGRSHEMSVVKCTVVAGAALVCAASLQARQAGPAPQTIDLAERLAGGKLRVVNREATAIKDRPGAIHLTGSPGNGFAWIDGTDFGEGTIEVEIRGRDVMQQSFVGIAFHGKDDKTYEAVYLRPFNFRSPDPTRHQHAVQYISMPDYDWPRLRKEFPEEFENPVDPSLSPTDWVHVKVVVQGAKIQIHAGPVQAPTLEVRKLGQLDRGLVGVWVGNTSEGDFANVRLTPAK